MKQTTSLALLCTILLLALLSACQSPQASGASAVDTNATVSAGVAGTATSQALFAQSVDDAVNATATALVQGTTEDEAPASATPPAAAPETAVAEVASEATPEGAAEPVETTVEYVALTEEELAAMIDDAVNEAVAATEAYYEATAQATADGDVTTEEVETITVTVENADEALAEAEALVAAYYEQYAELTVEAIDELSAIEAQLVELNASVDEMNAILASIDETLQAGLELAEETVAQLEAAAETAIARTEELAGQAEAWVTGVQQEVAARTARVSQVQPTAVAADRQEAVGQLFAYSEAVGVALQDDRVTGAELDQIAQLGANAKSGLQSHGGPQLQGLSRGIDQLTMQLARGGNIPQAKSSLAAFQGGLPQR